MTVGSQQNASTDSHTDCASIARPLADSSLLEKLRQRTITAAELLPLLVSYRLLPQLTRELIIDEAIAPFTCTFEETIQACKQFYEQNQIASEQDRQTWLERNSLSPAQLEAMITRNLRTEQFKQATWGPKLESYFLQRKRTLDRVIYSLIRLQDLNLAQELFFRIQEGEQSFADLAQQYSQGPEAQTGGLIGPIELSVPHPVLARQLSVSQPGQLLPPTRLGDWVVLVRLEKFLPCQLDDSMRQRLLNELFEAWVKEQIQALSH
ncbi:peptidylprolyl isomerase [Leptolyngbya sp. FACHB-36]|uniref:peptidylprolyl isomerase n=1 Tax=Leptolyngbya sp. FACHB-36 TaxID=2692808 RepID=UPI001680A11E|nr:peptidylprolyl isomerase [Leptolyngbya sp. FACHB-36]MBD2018854.1 peptidylprolyl isomerase [Leptolyngbya sp. FACHB-36]